MEKNILDLPFWKIALRFSLIFLVVIAIISLIITFVQKGNFHAITNSIQNGSWLRYSITKIAFALVYGIAMAYFSRRKEKRNLKK